MTNPLAMTNAQFGAQIEAHPAAIKALREVLRARTPTTMSTDKVVTIAVCEAAGLSGMSDSQVRRGCAAHPYDGAGGFVFGGAAAGGWRNIPILIIWLRVCAFECGRMRVCAFR
jgi:hypothetical protein